MMTNLDAPAAPTPLTRALDTVRKLKAQLQSQNGNMPLAVVGVGLRLPGGINDLDSYWDALAEGRDLVHPLPDSRKGPFAAEWEHLPHTGGFLDEVMDFDADFFGLDARAASGLDPQHRLMLEVAWEALENAGLPPDRLKSARTGLFIGITGQEYWDWQTGEVDTNWAAGNGHCFAVGRLAYAMDLAGPAIAVDTACSSSLVSVHLARQALSRRECDVAVAGGVNLVLSPRATRLHHMAGMLSPDGQCKAFDARANGFTRGEGCGMVVLKRLEDAQRDGDRIHAVLAGSAVNQSGRSNGFGAPHVLSQITLIETALADAGLSPADIGLVEAHGTGTSLGDTIEMEAIAAALGRKNGGATLPVGSAKTNMGHLESAAGVAAMIKAILCLQHRAVPPLVHFCTPNPLIDLDGTGITLPIALQPWSDSSGRYAAASAFGMGGTNAHVILGRADEPDHEAPQAPLAVWGFELSAKTPEVMRVLAARFHERLTQLPDESYPAFAYTATFGRARHTWRARVTAPDRASALEALRSLAEGEPVGSVTLAEQGKWQDEDSSRLEVLPRAVVDLPPYPWARQRYAPEPAGVPVVAATSAVGSTVPDSTVPDSTVPESTVPESTVPESTVPESTVPESTVPESTVPDSTVPDSTVPGSTVPATSAGHDRNPAEAPEADLVDDSLFEVTWREVPDRKADTAAGHAPDTGWWLLLADRGGLAAALRSQLEARSADCATVTVTVTPGERYRRLSESRYEIDPMKPGQLAALLDDLQATRDEPCAGVVHAWSLDAPPSDDVAQLSLWEAQATGPVSALHLIQALTGQSPDETPRLVLLTRGSQVVVKEDRAVALSQAPLWGLAAVASVEHGELRPTIIDLDPASGDADRGGEAALVLDQILRPDGDQRIALRGTARYRPVVIPSIPFAHGEPAWQRRALDIAQDKNHRVLAVQSGILSSLSPTLWERTLPGPGQIEIKVAAAGVNFSDVLKAMGVYPGASGTVPLGVECAGRVSALGEGVDGYRVGDEVMAVAPSAMAAYATTSSHLVARRPQSLTDEQAAATPVAFLTAVYGLSYLARLGAGEKVLIHSATGGVGLAALMVARQCGAEIFATAGTPAKRELLRSLGVSQVMDSRSLSFADEITELTNGYGVDVVLNSLTGEALARSLALLAPGGRFVEIGKRDIYDDSRIGLGSFKHNRSMFAVDMEQVLWERPKLAGELFDQIARGFESGQLEALPVTTYPYAEAGEAFARMAQAQHTGRLVLRPGIVEEIAVPPGRPPVRAGATYLVAGGLGATGLESARQLAGLGACHLALVDHRKPGDEAEALLRELRSRQVEVTVLDADLTMYDDVVAVLTRIDESMPPLTGIVHAADMPEMGMLCELDPDRLRTGAGSTTATGAWHLHRATVQRDLDFFILCSSAAAALGTAGRGNDAVAGAFLDALALHRREGGLPALCVNHEVIAALGSLLSTSVAGSRLLSLDPEELCSDAYGTPPLLPVALLAASDAPPGDSVEIRRMLMTVEPGRRRRAMLIQHCLDVAAHVLKREASQLDPGAPLASLGFDSMRTLELRARLETSLQVKLPATLGWRFPTIEALVPFLAERMEIELEASATTGVQPTGVQPTGVQPVRVQPTGVQRTGVQPTGVQTDLLVQAESPDLDELPDSDIEALLLARIEQLDEGQRR